MYAVAIYKATSGARIHGEQPTMPDAKDSAHRIYETLLTLTAHGVLLSGVAILVLPDDYAQQIDGKGIILLDTSKVLYQIGSY